MKSAQRTLNNDYNVSTCPKITITESEAIRDYNLGTNDRTGLMHCYCLSQYNKKGAGVRNLKFSDGNKY